MRPLKEYFEFYYGNKKAFFLSMMISMFLIIIFLISFYMEVFVFMVFFLVLALIFNQYAESHERKAIMFYNIDLNCKEDVEKKIKEMESYKKKPRDFEKNIMEVKDLFEVIQIGFDELSLGESVTGPKDKLRIYRNNVSKDDKMNDAEVIVYNKDTDEKIFLIYWSKEENDFYFSENRGSNLIKTWKDKW